MTVKTIKFLEENSGKDLWDLGIDKAFLERTQKAIIIKEKNYKLDFTKLKKPVHQKSPHKKNHH